MLGIQKGVFFWDLWKHKKCLAYRKEFSFGIFGNTRNAWHTERSFLLGSLETQEMLGIQKGVFFWNLWKKEECFQYRKDITNRVQTEYHLIGNKWDDPNTDKIFVLNKYPSVEYRKDNIPRGVQKGYLF
ncbi:hypothetical protein CDAR_206971 [Caerostris darwini]|uniref:Uncharacterized protein n=1 Tax=Caerostris darwini TaxID=1538125 RepID=A0AAV4SPC4_9ARAC|nr:hypothetical protein CDAR_206971 [Caerostris darwini]